MILPGVKNKLRVQVFILTFTHAYLATAPLTYGSTTLLHPKGTAIPDHTNTTQTGQSRYTKDTTQPIQINTRMNE